MAGSSRVPVSLRNFASAKTAAVRRSPYAVFNLDLFEPPSPCTCMYFANILNCRIRNVVFAYFILRHFRRAVRRLRGRGIFGTVVDVYSYAQRYAYGVFLNFPGVKSKVQGQVDEALKKLEDKLVQKGPGVTRYLALPKEGFTEEQAKAELKK